MPGSSRSAAHRRAAVLAVGLTVGGATSAVFAAPAAAAGGCPAGYFCAYDDSGYGRVLLTSNAKRGTEKVNVADDRVSSVINNTGNTWSGVSKNRALFDSKVLTVPPRSQLSYVGGKANDVIDHFDVF